MVFKGCLAWKCLGRQLSRFSVGFKAIALGGCCRCQPWWASVELADPIFIPLCFFFRSFSAAFWEPIQLVPNSKGPLFERPRSNYLSSATFHAYVWSKATTSFTEQWPCMEFQYEICCWGWGMVFCVVFWVMFGPDEMTWRHGQWTVTGRVGIRTSAMIIFTDMFTSVRSSLSL